MTDDFEQEVKEGVSAVVADLKRWQVHFHSGQGQQFVAATEAEVRAQVEKIYGSEYPVKAVTDITPPVVK